MQTTLEEKIANALGRQLLELMNRQQIIEQLQARNSELEAAAKAEKTDDQASAGK